MMKEKRKVVIVTVHPSTHTAKLPSTRRIRVIWIEWYHLADAG